MGRRRISGAIKKAGRKAKAGIVRASKTRRGKMLIKAVKAKGRAHVRSAHAAIMSRVK